MPQQRYYFRYTGPPCDGIGVLGFLIVTRPNYQGSQNTIQQYFSPSEHYPFDCAGCARSGRSYHYTFRYDTKLDAIEQVFIEACSDADSFDETDRILLGLLMRLQSVWFGYMEKDSSASWRSGLPGGTTWPNGLPPLSPVRERSTGGTSQPSCLQSMFSLAVAALIVLGVAILGATVLRGVVPVTIVDPTAATRPQATTFVTPPQVDYVVVTLPAPLITPTPVYIVVTPPVPQTDEGDCSSGCIYPPLRQCPDSMIKGFRSASDDKLYYATRDIVSYDTLPFDPITMPESRWFCTPQQAISMGYVAYH